MKKLLSIFIVFFITIGISYGYTPSSKDEKLLNTVYKKLDLIIDKSPSKIENLYKKIGTIKEKVKNKERIYYILTELENYSYEILTSRENIEYFVKKVIDGDTIKISYLGRDVNVRFIGIDTPESYLTRFGYKECYGDEAKDYLKDLLEGKNIELEIYDTQGKKDKYNRLLGYVIYNGENINNKLIEEGYAWEYTYDKIYRYQDLFKASEKEASESLKGLWSSNTCNGERLKVDEVENNTNNDLEIEDELNENTTDLDTNNSSSTNTYNSTYIYYTGKRGGCYYINSNGNKTYVDHSYCY